MSGEGEGNTFRQHIPYDPHQRHLHNSGPCAAHYYTGHHAYECSGRSIVGKIKERESVMHSTCVGVGDRAVCM